MDRSLNGTFATLAGHHFATGITTVAAAIAAAIAIAAIAAIATVAPVATVTSAAAVAVLAAAARIAARAAIMSGGAAIATTIVLATTASAAVRATIASAVATEQAGLSLVFAAHEGDANHSKKQSNTKYNNAVHLRNPPVTSYLP